MDKNGNLRTRIAPQDARQIVGEEIKNSPKNLADDYFKLTNPQVRKLDREHATLTNLQSHERADSYEYQRLQGLIDANRQQRRDITRLQLGASMRDVSRDSGAAEASTSKGYSAPNAKQSAIAPKAESATEQSAKTGNKLSINNEQKYPSTHSVTPDNLAALKKEALKYKTPEEFVKAHNNGVLPSILDKKGQQLRSVYNSAQRGVRNARVAVEAAKAAERKKTQGPMTSERIYKNDMSTDPAILRKELNDVNAKIRKINETPDERTGNTIHINSRTAHRQQYRDVLLDRRDQIERALKDQAHAEAKNVSSQTGRVSNKARDIKVRVSDGSHGVKIMTVKATPVKVVDGIDTVIHKQTDPGSSGWSVTETSSGLSLGKGDTRQAAINTAKANIEKAGLSKTKSLINEARTNTNYKPQRIDTKKARDIQKALDKPNLTPKQQATLNAALEKEQAKTADSRATTDNIKEPEPQLPKQPKTNEVQTATNSAIQSQELATKPAPRGIPNKLASKSGKKSLQPRKPVSIDPSTGLSSDARSDARTSELTVQPASASMRPNSYSRQGVPDQQPPVRAEAPETTRKASSNFPKSSLPNDNTKERGFTTSVKQSQNYSKQLRKDIASQYAVVGDKATIAKTINYTHGKSLDELNSDVLTRLNSSKRPDKQLINDAGTVMQMLDAKGKTDEAYQIFSKMAEHGTNAGQTSQALGLVLRRSPDGMYMKAISDLKKANVDITPDIDKQLKAMREDIRKTMPDTDERELAVNKLKNFVDTKLPSKASDKVFALWRAGLLTGPRTISKILTSHSIQLPLETIKDIPAAAIDKALSTITGKRSLVLTGKGIGAGLKQGAKAGFGINGTEVVEHFCQP